MRQASYIKTGYLYYYIELCRFWKGKNDRDYREGILEDGSSIVENKGIFLRQYIIFNSIMG